MNKKVVIIIGIGIFIGVLFLIMSKMNSEIPNNYIASVSYPHGEGTRTVYIYAKYDYKKTQTSILVAKYSYIEAATDDYRKPETYILKRGSLKDIDEVVSFAGDVTLNINARTINPTDDSIKKAYKKGDNVTEEEFRDILQCQEWQRTLN